MSISAYYGGLWAGGGWECNNSTLLGKYITACQQLLFALFVPKLLTSLWLMKPTDLQQVVSVATCYEQLTLVFLEQLVS